jgi:hypothetical protein
MAGLKYNGIDLEATYGLQVTNIEGLESPRIRSNTVVIPGLDGVLDFGGTYDERTIFVTGYVSSDTSHADVLAKLQSIHQIVSAVPSIGTNVPVDGMPLSLRSGLSMLEVPDFTDRYFPVIFNGVFEVIAGTNRRATKDFRVRIGFRQPNPAALGLTKTTAVKQISAANKYMLVANAGGLYVPPLVSLEATGTVNSFSIYNMNVDPFVTNSWTGTKGGSLTFSSSSDLATVIGGAVKFALGTAFVTFSATNIFREEGAVELLYTPSFNPEVKSAVLWTLYISATEYWRCWYDHTVNKFKFETRNGGTITISESTLGFTTGAVLHLLCRWTVTQISIFLNGVVGTTVSKTSIAEPSTIRVGSFGDNTLPADGLIDEFIVWSRDVGADYPIPANSRRRPFGRPIVGVAIYAPFDFSIDATGAGDKILTFGVTTVMDTDDIIFIDMEKQTAFFWDASAETKASVITEVSNVFWELVPGTNAIRIPKTGAGDLITTFEYVKRFLI